MTSSTQAHEANNGLRSILQFAWAYEAFQRSVGKNKLRRQFVDHKLKPARGSLILDVGCGPGDLVPFLSDSRYVGYDINERYISAARARFGNDASFLCGGVDQLDQLEGTVDQAVSIGVLHHVPDDVAHTLLTAVKRSLKPGGRFLAVEPHIYPGQNWIARELIKHDRGQFVRREDEYADICGSVFDDVSVERDEKLMRVPYTVSIYSCV